MHSVGKFYELFCVRRSRRRIAGLADSDCRVCGLPVLCEEVSGFRREIGQEDSGEGLMARPALLVLRAQASAFALCLCHFVSATARTMCGRQCAEDNVRRTMCGGQWSVTMLAAASFRDP